jgi:hypothetical protein
MAASEHSCWAVLWRSHGSIDGERQHRLLGIPDGCSRVRMFPTRRAALAYIKENYNYIRYRRDLRDEPFGWRMPLPVRVNVRVETIGEAVA